MVGNHHLRKLAKVQTRIRCGLNKMLSETGGETNKDKLEPIFLTIP